MDQRYERLLAEKDEEIQDLSAKVEALREALNKDDMDDFEKAIAEKNKVLEEQFDQIEHLRSQNKIMAERLESLGSQAAHIPQGSSAGVPVEELHAQLAAEQQLRLQAEDFARRAGESMAQLQGQLQAFQEVVPKLQAQAGRAAELEAQLLQRDAAAAAKEEEAPTDALAAALEEGARARAHALELEAQLAQAVERCAELEAQATHTVSTADQQAELEARVVDLQAQLQLQAARAADEKAEASLARMAELEAQAAALAPSRGPDQQVPLLARIAELEAQVAVSAAAAEQQAPLLERLAELEAQAAASAAAADQQEALRQRVVQLEALLGERAGEVAGLQARAGDLEAQLEEARAAVAEQARAGDLETQLEEARAAVAEQATLRARVAELEGQAAAAQADGAAAQAVLHERVKELECRLAETAAAAAQQQALADARAQELESRLAHAAASASEQAGAAERGAAELTADLQGQLRAALDEVAALRLQGDELERELDAAVEAQAKAEARAADLDAELRQTDSLRARLAVLGGRLAHTEAELRAERAVNSTGVAAKLRAEVAHLTEALVRERQEREREEAHLAQQVWQAQEDLRAQSATRLASAGAQEAALLDRIETLRRQRDQARSIASCIQQQASLMTGELHRLRTGEETTGEPESAAPQAPEGPWNPDDPERTLGAGPSAASCASAASPEAEAEPPGQDNGAVDSPVHGSAAGGGDGARHTAVSSSGVELQVARPPDEVPEGPWDSWGPDDPERTVLEGSASAAAAASPEAEAEPLGQAADLPDGSSAAAGGDAGRHAEVAPGDMELQLPRPPDEVPEDEAWDAWGVDDPERTMLQGGAASAPEAAMASPEAEAEPPGQAADLLDGIFAAASGDAGRHVEVSSGNAELQLSRPPDEVPEGAAWDSWGPDDPERTMLQGASGSSSAPEAATASPEAEAEPPGQAAVDLSDGESAGSGGAGRRAEASSGNLELQLPRHPDEVPEGAAWDSWGPDDPERTMLQGGGASASPEAATASPEAEPEPPGQEAVDAPDDERAAGSQEGARHAPVSAGGVALQVPRPPDEVTSGWDVFDPDDQIEHTIPTAPGGSQGNAPAADGDGWDLDFA